MKTVNKFNTFEELYVLSVKKNYAKILLSLMENQHKRSIVDTLFMFEDNETMYEFLMDQLSDVIEFNYDTDRHDYNSLINFINKATEHLKDKLSL